MEVEIAFLNENVRRERNIHFRISRDILFVDAKNGAYRNCMSRVYVRLLYTEICEHHFRNKLSLIYKKDNQPY